MCYHVVMMRNRTPRYNWRDQPPIVGRRVEAWTGHRAGQTGEVVGTFAVNVWVVRWDDGHEERYRAADMIRVEV